ncbi:MAG TPA: DinB family protein, partial [Acidobacteriaceae bacterium]|nr:DinB family protein [Acidobacteriaceae bacterium]
LLLDLDPEITNTRRTLERIPADKPDWVPHAKSMPMGRLAMHCATLPLFGSYILTDEGMDLAAPKRPHVQLVYTSPEDLLQHLDDSAAKLRSALASATDDQLAQNWPFTWGPQVISNTSRTLTYRMMFLNHLVHHTAQLGVYLRLLDLPVPGLYGPSADEQWQPK